MANDKTSSTGIHPKGVVRAKKLKWSAKHDANRAYRSDLYYRHAKNPRYEVTLWHTQIEALRAGTAT